MLSLNLFNLLLLIFTTWSGAPLATEYRLIPAESRFQVEVSKAGFLAALAHDHVIGIRGYSGRVVLSPRGIADSGMELRIDTRSLVVLDEKVSTGDRAKITRSMHEEVLESARYPEAIFRSTGMTGLTEERAGEIRFQLTGDLTLHGVTRSIVVPISLRRLNGEARAGELRATGRYVLKQTDFGIRPYSTAGGAIKVKNEVVIDFQITARG
jgi:polyisoprenoid-binding protein YceI